MRSKFPNRTGFTVHSARGFTPWMRRITFARSALFAISLLGAAAFGCNGDDREHGDGPTTHLLTDAHNYTSTTDLEIPTIETAPGVDLDICWTDVVSDIQCHELDPLADLDQVSLLRFLNLTEDDVEAHIEADDLPQSAIDGYLSIETDHESSCTKLSSLTLLGTEVDVTEHYVESDENTYMLLFAQGLVLGQGARNMVFLEPTSESDVTRVDAPAGCGLLDFQADLTSPERLSVPKDRAPILDWSGMTADGQGKTIVFRNIDRVMLAFYAGMTLSEIEERIFDLEIMATSLYELELTGGRTADLAQAVERDSGESFTNFEREEDGVWLAGLICSTCRNPAPLVLTVIEPRD